MKEIWKYILSDFYRYYGMGGGKIKLLLIALTAKNHCFAYTFWLRLCTKKNPFFFLAKWMHYRLSRKYGIQISPKTKIGYGLFIGHGVGIVINDTAVIGNNVNLSQFLTIGSNHGKAANIGNNVYIGPSVCIVEDVNIGDNVIIGAGCVVTTDVPDNFTAVGVPNRLISKVSHNYISNPWKYEKI